MSSALIAVLVILAIALIVVGAAIALRRRARRVAEDEALEESQDEALSEPGLLAPAMHPAPSTQPVVLVHGLLGFDHIALLGQRVVYFRGIAELLREQGVTVYTAKLPPAASVPERARALADMVHGLPCQRVNLIAHSMGGLDSRYAIARFGLDERVASLTTIATPHRGTPLADLVAGACGIVPMRALRTLIGRVGLQTAAVDWLTTQSTGVINRDIRDADGVLYGSIVGRAQRQAMLSNPVLLSGHMYIAIRAGANDGMVPVTSQCWGEVLDEIDADHWAQIGWSSHYDAGAVYRRLLDQLRRRGL